MILDKITPFCGKAANVNDARRHHECTGRGDRRIGVQDVVLEMWDSTKRTTHLYFVETYWLSMGTIVGKQYGVVVMAILGSVQWCYLHRRKNERSLLQIS